MTTAKYPRLFEPGKIGKLEVKNRLVYPPVTTNFAGPTGEPTERLIKYYAERARGGVGLIIVENTQVKYPEGKNTSCQLRLDQDKYIPGFRELAEAVQVHGTKIFQQIHHAGRQAHAGEEVQYVAPSAIPCGLLQEPVRELTVDEIWDLIERFSETALRVKKAGMDGVEFHGAHGYLINEFLSPHTNKRTDEWGGSLENRMRFLLEIIKRSREKVGPDFPLCLRYSADEFVPGGLTVQESKEIARRVEAAGIDILHVSAGIYESAFTLLDTMHHAEGWRVYLADEIKKVVNIPVITVGQIKTPAFAEKVLEEGKADFVAIGRALVADPQWPNKAAEGRDEDIRKCISCDSCIGTHVFCDLYMRCTVNPVVGHEREPDWVTIQPAEKKKKVMVVGGGPGGMEAAHVAALRGHDVTLYEKGNELGGQLKAAAAAPGKGKINYIKEYYSTQLKKAGVKLELGKEVDGSLIQDSKPEVLIIATGAELFVPDIPGASGENVLCSLDVLSGDVKVDGQKIVVQGGGVIGCETALYLAEQGKKVTIVSRMKELAIEMEPVHRFELLTQSLPQAGVEIFTETTITEFLDNGVRVKDCQGRASLIEADNIILASGMQAQNKLKESAVGVVPEVYVIGDSKAPRKIQTATFEGSWVARII